MPRGAANAGRLPWLGRRTPNRRLLGALSAGTDDGPRGATVRHGFPQKSAVNAGLVLSASMTMVSPSSSSASSVTVIVTVPAVSPSARVIVVDESV